MGESVFTQREYNDLCRALDRAMEVLLDLGKSEDSARACLGDFVTDHCAAFCKQRVIAAALVLKDHPK